MSKYGKASRSAPPAQKKSGGNTLVGIFVGLVIGVLVAFGVVLYLNKAPLPFQDHKTEAAKADEKKPAPVAGQAAASAATPAPLPGKPGDKVGDKQRFEFYGILEGKQQATPGAAPATSAPTAAAPAAAPAAEAKAAPSEVFFLQAGAFQKPADADNLKAKIALTGLEVGTQEAAVPDKGTMYRVRVGPFRSPDEMNKARTQLAQSGIQATVVKQKE